MLTKCILFMVFFISKGKNFPNLHFFNNNKKNAQLKLDKTKQKHDFVYLLLLFRIFKTALIVFSFAVKLHVTEKVQFLIHFLI